MRIIVYPETKDGTIGRFEDDGVETCILISGMKDELQIILDSLCLCRAFHNPLIYLQDLYKNLKMVDLTSLQMQNVFNGIEFCARIDKRDLLSLVSKNVNNPYGIIFFDIQRMKQTANDIMDVTREQKRNLKSVFLKDRRAVITSLSAALELVLTGGIPLKDRFDIFEDDYVDMSDYDFIIKAIKAENERKCH